MLVKFLRRRFIKIITSQARYRLATSNIILMINLRWSSATEREWVVFDLVPTIAKYRAFLTGWEQRTAYLYCPEQGEPGMSKFCVGFDLVQKTWIGHQKITNIWSKFTEYQYNKVF